MYYISRIAGAVALCALGIGVWFSIVLARADFYFRQATPETVARAVEITPRNTEYLALRALQLAYGGADSTGTREEIAALNPVSSAPRIGLGLSAEVAGDLATAEKWLLEAASVDHQFEPRWTLANFYFRNERPDDFWRWMRAALDVSYGDRTPSFDLCWRVSADAGEILRRALPDRHDVITAYLVYLSQTKRLSALADVARRVAAFHDRSDLPLLLGACDQLVEARDSAALEVWQLAGQAVPLGIYNGDFATTPMNHGFDWRLLDPPGVMHVRLDPPAGHRIVLNGQQAESCSLLRESLILGTARRYRLQWESLTSGIRSPSGLSWRVAGQQVSVLPKEDWVKGDLVFVAPERFHSLELFYQRPVGEPRAQGSVELRNVRLAEVQP